MRGASQGEDLGMGQLGADVQKSRLIGLGNIRDE